MKLVLGIDQGIASVGYGIIDIESGKIVDAGVRLFDEADNTVHNTDRRSFRSSRRLKRRKANRREDLKKILKENNVFSEYSNTLNPYDCRIKGLKNKISLEELNCALFNIAKHRGSSLEVVEDENNKSEDEKGTKYNLQKNDEIIKSGKYVCEIQKERLQSDGKIRGISNNFRSADYEKELKKILSNQNLTEEANNSIVECILRRRHFSDGPGSFKSQTPYGKEYYENGEVKLHMIQKMAGKCSIYPTEKRAPKNSPSAEFFNLLNDLNNLRIDDEPIDIEIKKEIVKKAFEKGSITPIQISKVFNADVKDIDGFKIDKSEKPMITELKGFKTLKKIFEEHGKANLLKNFDILDRIAEILTDTKIISERIINIRNIEGAAFEDDEKLVEELANLNKFSNYHSLSLKAIKELNEEMYNTEYNQSQILHLSNKYEFRDKNGSQKGKKKIQINDEAILSPVALRSYKQAIKVINSARKKYGEFDSIVIETTRDKNSQEEKKRISDNQKFFENRNRKVEEVMRNYPNIQLNGKLREKIVLYEEQQCKTIYTQKAINLDTLINDPTAYEVDHIIPISISLDDSINNKVLATREENQKKENLSPIMAFEAGKFSNFSKEQYIDFVNRLNITKKKRNNLLYTKDINKYENMKAFINRNLVDTSYANRLLLNTLSDYFKDNKIETNVHTIKGIATNRFRKYLKLEKDREKDYSHHAIDALLIASVKKMNLYNKLLKDFSLNEKEVIFNRKTGEIIERIEENDLTEEEIRFIKQIGTFKVEKFSWAKDTKPNRSISDQTIYGTRKYGEGEFVIKRIKNIYEKKQSTNRISPLADDIINNKAKNKYLIYRNDPMSAEKLEKVVHHYFDLYKDDKDRISKDSKGEVIFNFNPFYELVENHPENKIHKYSKKNNGPIIESLRYIDGKLGSHIDISNKYSPNNKKVVLLQLSPYRTDFYRDNETYKFITIRYSDIRYEGEKRKYVINKNWYEEQLRKKSISSDAKFVFSLHHNELVQIIDDKNDDSIKRFRATKDDQKNIIEMKPIDCYNERRDTSTIAKKTKKMKKYCCDPLGNLYECKNEKLKFEF